MTKTIVFIQIQDRSQIIEAELAAEAVLGELHDALAAAGVKVDAETFIFVDDCEEHLQGERHHPIRGLKHGCRIHVSRCHRIKVAVHFLERTVDREFPPGARVRAVKEWAVKTFGINSKDAAEHVLKFCDTKEQPSTDTPLIQLVKHEHHAGGEAGEMKHRCGLCFDLVPDKRVEG